MGYCSIPKSNTTQLNLASPLGRSGGLSGFGFRYSEGQGGFVSNGDGNGIYFSIQVQSPYWEGQGDK